METRSFEDAVYEVLAEAARCLLAEHDKLKEERGDPVWLGSQFMDDTESHCPSVMREDFQMEPCGDEQHNSDETTASCPALLLDPAPATPPLQKAKVNFRALTRCLDSEEDNEDKEEEPASPKPMSEVAPASEYTQRSDDDTCKSADFQSGIEGVCNHSGRESTSRNSHSFDPNGMTFVEFVELGEEGRRQQAMLHRNFFHRMRYDPSYRHSVGEALISIVVIGNIITMGISTDFFADWPGWTALDACFAAIFTIECTLKLSFLGPREYFLGRDAFWNIFELLLAMFAAFEVLLTTMQDTAESRLSLLRVVRLARLARVIRICRLEAFSDLMMMINGAVGGARTLFWSIILISLPLYAVSLLLRETLGVIHHDRLRESTSVSSTGLGNPLMSASAAAAAAAAGEVTDDELAAQVAAEAFSSLPWAFFNVFRCVVGQDCSSKDGKPLFVHVASAYGWGYGLVYCVTMLLMTFGLFNVIVAIYVENTVAAAKGNERIMKQHRLNDQQLVAEKLHALMEVMAIHAKGTARSGGRASGTLEDSFRITPALWDILKDDMEVIEIFRGLDINDADLRDLFDTLDSDGSGEIDFQEMCHGLTKLRGDANRSDVVGIKLTCRSIQAQLSELSAEFQRLAAAQAAKAARASSRSKLERG